MSKHDRIRRLVSPLARRRHQTRQPWPGIWSFSTDLRAPGMGPCRTAQGVVLRTVDPVCLMPERGCTQLGRGTTLTGRRYDDTAAGIYNKAPSSAAFRMSYIKTSKGEGREATPRWRRAIRTSVSRRVEEDALHRTLIAGIIVCTWPALVRPIAAQSAQPPALTL